MQHRTKFFFSIFMYFPLFCIFSGFLEHSSKTKKIQQNIRKYIKILENPRKLEKAPNALRNSRKFRKQNLNFLENELVFCIRGGYGCPHLIFKTGTLIYAILKSFPKWTMHFEKFHVRIANNKCKKVKKKWKKCKKMWTDW